MTPTGAMIRRLTGSRAIDSSPSWSPSNSDIVFISDRSGAPQLYVTDVEGVNVRRLVYNNNYVDSPAWSPTVICWARLCAMWALARRLEVSITVSSETPSSADGSVEILNGHTVTVPAATSLSGNNLTVDAGGILVADATLTLTGTTAVNVAINNPSGVLDR